MKKRINLKLNALFIIGIAYLQLFWKKSFSYKKVNIEKSILKYLKYEYWKVDEMGSYNELISFATITAQKDFGKNELKLKDPFSWDIYTDFYLTKLIYQKFEKLPHVYALNKGNWLFVDSITLSEDGKSMEIKTENGTTTFSIKDETIINGKTYVSDIDDWLCFKLTAEGNKKLAVWI